LALFLFAEARRRSRGAGFPLRVRCAPGVAAYEAAAGVTGRHDRAGRPLGKKRSSVRRSDRYRAQQVRRGKDGEVLALKRGRDGIERGAPRRPAARLGPGPREPTLGLCLGVIGHV